MRIFNTQALSSKQRFTRALIAGIPSALGLGMAYGTLTRILPIRFSIVYIGIGWLIGRIIQENGRGVQPRFSLLAAGLALISFLLADGISVVGFSIFAMPTLLFLIPLSYLNSLNGLLNLLFIAGGVFMAYDQARIL